MDRFDNSSSDGLAAVLDTATPVSESAPQERNTGDRDRLLAQASIGSIDFKSGT